MRFVIAIIALMISFSAYASPKCQGLKHCSGDVTKPPFDYRSQSSFGELQPGDTTRVKLVLYSNNEVRIAVCHDEFLGDVYFRVIKLSREYNRRIDRIENIVKNKEIFALDPSGNKVLGADGKPIVERIVEVQATDTVWITERNLKEELVFEGKGKDSFYQSKIERTGSVVVEVIVPQSSSLALSEKHGTVGILVGRRPAEPN
jgi:hypothetical protein